MSSEQEAFEAWAMDISGTELLPKKKDGGYMDAQTTLQLLAWRAARAPLLARIAELEAQAAENEENDLARDEKLRALSASHEIGCG